jgi:urease accessory protein
MEHPIFGLDHVIAMVAVGMWSAQLGRPAIWVLPITFPLVMALGGALGVAGIPITGIEYGIALSALVLGGLVLFAVRLPLPAACVLVGVFAIFHGYAHGAELPESAGAVAYTIGFVLATVLLHLIGIGMGLHRWPSGVRVLQGGGAVVAAGGIFFLMQAVGV